MRTGVIDEMQENQLSDEEYVIYRTKNSHKHDLATAKAWMITAKTLFARNFAVQLEAYTTQKSANNPKEAARYFSSLFFDFPNEAEWSLDQLIETTEIVLMLSLMWKIRKMMKERQHRRKHPLGELVYTIRKKTGIPIHGIILYYNLLLSVM
ncbi:uncharacterized protein LOC130685484 [Daphnia carinata]|uniref:uncharacterized protein LOC130685484 n=1 Tax=Daphnia carinata TaxID=120202 RepID=UPI0025794C1C|nr:uncharacterized protein LOC130685484 [Daphnia carinata]